MLPERRTMKREGCVAAMAAAQTATQGTPWPHPTLAYTREATACQKQQLLYRLSLLQLLCMQHPC